MDMHVIALPRCFRRGRATEQQPAQQRSRFRKRDLSIAASLFMASCEGTITTDLATEVPADPNIRQVVAPFLGIEFQRSDGGTESIELTNAEAIDLMAYVIGDPIRLLTDEDLPEGNYTGVRLKFDPDDTDNAYVIDGIGSERTLAIADGEYADMEFNVEEDESSSESLILTLDLRLSLSSNDQDEFRLTPVLRSVPADQAGVIQGTVTAACLSEDLGQNAPAVYLFEGEDVTADDFDGEDAEPFATAPVSTQLTYELRFIPAGSYTIALACSGIEEDPTTDDDLDFQATQNIELDEGETLQQDLTT
jgi:hypothetical protein